MGRGNKEVSRERERRAWELRQQLWTQERIAADLGVDQSAVSLMLRRAERRVLAELSAEILEAKARQTAQLERLADEAAQAWEKGKTADQYDSRMLAEIRNALADIRDIWGMNAPQKVAATVEQKEYAVVNAPEKL